MQILIYIYIYTCRLLDMTIKTRRKWELCLRLIHIWFLTTSRPRYCWSHAYYIMFRLHKGTLLFDEDIVCYSFENGIVVYWSLMLSIVLFFLLIYFFWHLFHWFKIGERTANILKHLFPVPKPDSKRIITFANQADYVSFRLVSLFTMSLEIITFDTFSSSLFFELIEKARLATNKLAFWNDTWVVFQ